MKVLAVLLLCAFVAVQGRSAVAKNSKALAALGENPWLVHLRIAVSTSGLLNTCAGSLIDNRWVLTATSCVSDARFIWIRYGAVNVINPSLVTETSAVRNSGDGLSLVNINRYVETTPNIGPLTLSSSQERPESAVFCSYGATETGGPGEALSCVTVPVASSEDGAIVSTDAGATSFDIGAPLVLDGVQIGVLVDADGTFLPVSDSISWIEQETGLAFGATAV